MNTYLAIITTALVITQIIRLIQNTISMNMQNQMIKNQLTGIEDITQQDLDNQRNAYILLTEYLENKLKNEQNGAK